MNEDPHTVVELAGRVFGMTPAVICGEGRARDVARARWAVAMVLHGDGYSTVRIGQHLNKNHTTVMYGLREGHKALSEDPVFARQFSELFSLVSNGRDGKDSAKERLLRARAEASRKANKRLLSENELLRAELRQQRGRASTYKRNRDYWKAKAKGNNKPVEKTNKQAPAQPKKSIMRLPDWMVGREKPAGDAMLSTVRPKTIKVTQDPARRTGGAV